MNDPSTPYMDLFSMGAMSGVAPTFFWDADFAPTDFEKSSFWPPLFLVFTSVSENLHPEFWNPIKALDLHQFQACHFNASP